jgi:hypothetical protein
MTRARGRDRLRVRRLLAHRQWYAGRLMVRVDHSYRRHVRRPWSEVYERPHLCRTHVGQYVRPNWPCPRAHSQGSAEALLKVGPLHYNRFRLIGFWRLRTDGRNSRGRVHLGRRLGCSSARSQNKT